MGRKTSFSESRARIVLEHIKNGGSLRSLKEVEPRSVFRWLEVNEKFRQQYARACEIRADAWLEEIIQIADDGSNDTYLDEEGNPRTDHDVINRSKLRVDARKWAMSKAQPKKYGDKAEDEGDKPTEAITINVYSEDKPARYADTAGTDKKIA